MSTDVKMSFTDRVKDAIASGEGPVSAASIAKDLDKSEAIVKGAFTRLANDGVIRLDEEGNATLPSGEITEVIRSRTARSSGVLVEFLRTTDGYAARCAHGSVIHGTKRYETARLAASPEDWCEECRALAEERAAARQKKTA